MKQKSELRYYKKIQKYITPRKGYSRSAKYGSVLVNLGKGWDVAQSVECLPSKKCPEIKPQYHQTKKKKRNLGGQAHWLNP
jgi:hypothetical protein